MYGGTKSEMERLLADAEKLSGVHYDINNLSDVYTAIHVIQTEMGITGTTAKEAEHTISGSIGMMKASWSNLLIALGDGNNDISDEVDDLVNSIGLVFDNITPVAKNAIEGVGKLVNLLLPKIIKSIPKIVKEYAPLVKDTLVNLFGTILETIQEIDFAGAGAGLLEKLITGIQEGIPKLADALAHLFDNAGSWLSENLPGIIDGAITVVETLLTTLRENLPKIVEAGGNFLLSIAQGIADSLPRLIEALPGIITTVTGFITDNLPTIVQKGIEIIVALVKGIISAIPVLIENLPAIVSAITTSLLDADWSGVGKTIIQTIWDGIKALFSLIPDGLKKIAETAFNFVRDIDWVDLGKKIINFILEGITALITAIPNLMLNIATNAFNFVVGIDWVGLGRKLINFIREGIDFLFNDIPNKMLEIAQKAFDKFGEIDWWKIGKNIIKGIKSGIKDHADELYNKVKEISEGLLTAAENWLGINSPSKKFRDFVGKPIAEGIGVGIEKGMPVKKMKDSLQEVIDAMADADMSEFDEFGNSLFDGVEAPELTDEVLTMRLDDDGKGRAYPADNITFNIYPRDGQDEKRIAEETMKLFTKWDNQKRRAFA